MNKKILLLGFVGCFVITSTTVFAESAKYNFNFERDFDRLQEVNSGDVLESNLLINLYSEEDVVFGVEFGGIHSNIASADADNSNLNLKNWVDFPDGSSYEVVGTLPGVQSLVIPFVVTIPDSIAPGDYLAMFRLSLLDKEQQKDIGQGAGVKLTTAIGLPVKFSVPGKRVHSLQVMDLAVGDYSFDIEKGPRFIDLILKYKNLGNAFIQINGDFKLYDYKGNLILEESKMFGNSSPSGKEVDKTVKLFELPQVTGWLDVEADITYKAIDSSNKVSSDAFPAGKAKLRIYLVPWRYLFVLVLLVVFGLLYYTFKHFRLLRLLENSQSYLVKDGDTLQSLSQKYQVEPKDVVILNKLKSPFILLPKTKILIPKNEKK